MRSCRRFGSRANGLCGYQHIGGLPMADQKRAVSPARVLRANTLRALPLLKALDALGAYAKEDRSFVPTASKRTHRYHVSVNNRDYELLICEQKWFDTRANKGGGGAIDLTMHLFSESFSRAFGRLDKLV